MGASDLQVMQLRRNLPWRIKLLIKVVCGLLPVDYAAFARIGLFRHGRMDDPQHALEIFGRHFPKTDLPQAPFTFLEIGPGDSLSSAIIAAAMGAERSYLVDVGDFVSRDLHGYRRLAVQLFGEGFLRENKLDSLDDVKAVFRIQHLTTGLAALQEVPDSTVDVAFSNACLEHVHAAEIPALFAQLKRVMKPGAVSSHAIDFKDHLAYSLNNLRFSRRFWEGSMIKRSGAYTNRLRLSDMLGAMQSAGFKYTVVQQVRWEKLPLDRKCLHPDFQGYPMDDLLTKEACVRLS